MVATGTGSTFSYTPAAAGADFVTVTATDTSTGQVTGVHRGRHGDAANGTVTLTAVADARRSARPR